MKYFLLISLLITGMATKHSYAEGGGDRVGNGGDVVLCNDGRGDEVLYILDEYESLENVKIGISTLDYTQKLNILLNRIRRFFPERYQYYTQILASFKYNLTLSKSSLPEINDAKESIGYSCEISQIAFFSTDKTGKHKYFILERIWNKLSEDQKAILLLHELLYTEAADLGHTTSYYIRKVNRMIFGEKSFKPEDIDSLFIRPIEKGINSVSLIKALKNVYSPNIAIFLLNQDFSRIYNQEGLKKSLLLVKSRFIANHEVKNLVERHLGNIK